MAQPMPPACRLRGVARTLVARPYGQHPPKIGSKQALFSLDPLQLVAGKGALNHSGAFISKESDEETARSIIQKHGNDCDAVMADVIRCFRSFDCVCVIEQPPDGQARHGLAKVLARDDGCYLTT